MDSVHVASKHQHPSLLQVLPRSTVYFSLLILSTILSLSLLLTASLSPPFLRWLTIYVEDWFQEVAAINTDLDCNTILKLGVMSRTGEQVSSHIPFLLMDERR